MEVSHEQWVRRIKQLLILVVDPTAVAVLQRCADQHSENLSPNDVDAALRDEMWETFCEDVDPEVEGDEEDM